MNKRTVKTMMVVSMLLVVALYFVSGTYARYSTEFTGNDSIQVAKWAVKLQGDVSGEKTSLDLTFTPKANENVVDNRIAPSVEATSKISLDLEDTEVAVDVILDLDESGLGDLVTSLGIDPSDITFTSAMSESNVVTATSGDGKEGSPFYIKLPSNKAFTAENGKVDIDLTLKWKNTEAHNANDTAAGKQAGTLTIPVKVTVRQHIDE